MLQIFVYGTYENGFIDLFPSMKLNMEALTELFNEDFDVSEFSLPVDVPWTENNRRILSYAERIENFTEPKRYWTCDVYDDRFPVFQGAKLTILEKEGALSYRNGKFSCTISGITGLFGSQIKDKKLRSLKFGGDITWEDMDSREFATLVMKNRPAQYSHLAFAPVVIENFFDTSRNYNDEFLVQDTVNVIVTDATGDEDGWTFDRPRSGDGEPTREGEIEHLDYRTVPFFQYKYILRKVFEELGYEVQGAIFQDSRFDNLYLHNTTSIELYSLVIQADVNRTIRPADHVPDILIKDFLKAAFTFFNMYPVFQSFNRVELVYRVERIKRKNLFNLTPWLAPNFKSTYKDVTESTGYKIVYQWDDKDDYHGERIKDLTQKTLVATITTLASIGSVDPGRPLTTDDLVYVTSENLYYVPADATVTPVLWEVYSERIEDYTVGSGGREVNLGMGTLCTYIQFDENLKLNVRRNKVACRQTGTYFNNKRQRITSDFGLSVFYISKRLIGGKLIPVSYNHNTNPSGTVLEPVSLIIDNKAGIGPVLHKDWQDLKEKNETVKITVNVDKKVFDQIREADGYLIDNIEVVAEKLEYSLPLDKTIDMEAVPL